MGQFKTILSSLSNAQRATIAAVVLLVIGSLYALVSWRKEADFKALYKGLAPEDSAAVVQKLKESGTPFRLTEAGDAISVPSAKVAELRLEMAAAGLPKTGRIGFEIFDKANLGATEFVEHINYRRALEGELERSLGALAEVELARIHITFPKDSVFLESREPAKASVLIKLKPGARLSPRNVTAIAHLVSNAVEGLKPEAVSVLDMQGNLLSRPTPASADEAASDAALDYRQKVERDLLHKINATLDPLLGHEHYRAGVSVDCDLSSGEQSEETLDPARSVMVQSQKTEEVSGGLLSAGVPGTASNLPRPTSRPGSSGSSSTRRTENISYQSSRMTRTLKLPVGAIKRVSVALLLDQSVRWEGTGKSQRRVLTPPSPETLKSVREVTAAVVGFVQDRDLITVESLPFENTLNQAPPEAPPAAPVQSPSPWKNPSMLRLVIGAAVLVVLLVGAALFLILRQRRKAAHAEIDMTKSLPGSPAESAALEAANLETRLLEREAEQERADMEALASIKLPPVKTKKAEILAKQLKENAQKDPFTSANILQAWIHERG